MLFENPVNKSSYHEVLFDLGICPLNFKGHCKFSKEAKCSLNIFSCYTKNTLIKYELTWMFLVELL